MWDWIVERVYTDPERMIERGQACASVGMFLLFAGTVGWAARHIAGIVQLRAAKAPAESLAALFGAPMATFWIPEGIGFVIAAALAAFGVWSVITGRHLKPFFNGRR